MADHVAWRSADGHDAKTEPAIHPDDEQLRALATDFPTKHMALFIYALTGGGAQRRTLTLANAFAACGHQMDLVVVRSEGVLNGELSPRVRMVGLDRGWGRVHVVLGRLIGQRGAETCLSIMALARYLRDAQPDVLLSAASHVNLAAVCAWHLARIPMALVLRASNHPSGNLRSFPVVERSVRAYLRWLARRLYRRADSVVAVSEGVGAEVARLTGMARDRIITIYNPVLTSSLVEKIRGSLEHPWFAPGAPPVILSAGRFTMQKDFRTLIGSFQHLRAKRAARLVILGDGPQRRSLQRLVDDLGLGAGVLLPGYVENPMAWMKQASVFVLCSRWEGLPAVLIEALACGCPVVSTDCPSGPAEILERGAHGLLVPVGDPRALAAAIETVLDQPPDRTRLRARAGHFGLGGAVRRYLEVLEECIRKRAPARLAWRPPEAFTAALGCVSDASLDYQLGRFCMARGDLFTAFRGNARHRQLMAQIMAHFGIEPHTATERYWEALKAADTICSRCPAVERCRSWLERRHGKDMPAAFCPNAGLFNEIAFATGERPEGC